MDLPATSHPLNLPLPLRSDAYFYGFRYYGKRRKKGRPSAQRRSERYRLKKNLEFQQARRDELFSYFMGVAPPPCVFASELIPAPPPTTNFDAFAVKCIANCDVSKETFSRKLSSYSTVYELPDYDEPDVAIIADSSDGSPRKCVMKPLNPKVTLLYDDKLRLYDTYPANHLNIIFNVPDSRLMPAQIRLAKRLAFLLDIRRTFGMPLIFDWYYISKDRKCGMYESTDSVLVPTLSRHAYLNAVMSSLAHSDLEYYSHDAMTYFSKLSIELISKIITYLSCDDFVRLCIVVPDVRLLFGKHCKSYGYTCRCGSSWKSCVCADLGLNLLFREKQVIRVYNDVPVHNDQLCECMSPAGGLECGTDCHIYDTGTTTDRRVEELLN